MRALYEILHAEPGAAAFEMSIVVTGVAGNCARPKVERNCPPLQ